MYEDVAVNNMEEMAYQNLQKSVTKVIEENRVKNTSNEKKIEPDSFDIQSQEKSISKPVVKNNTKSNTKDKHHEDDSFGEI